MRNRRIRASRFGCLVPILFAGMHTSALAQAGAAIDGGSSAPSSEIGEIIVTAQKRAENLQRVAISVSAIDANTIARTGISTVNDVASKVPSLGVTESIPTQVSYKLRGLGNEADITTFEPEVALFFDGAYRIKAPFGAADLIDVERIEVLKGPQASLYGKNATAGVINIVTAAPSQDFSGALDLDVNQYRARTRGYVTGGLSEEVAARVSYFVIRGISSTQDSIGADKAGGYAGTQWGVRPQISVAPSDRLNIRLIGGYVYRKLLPPTSAMFYSPVDAAVQSAVLADPVGLAAADPDGLTDGIINADAEPFDPRVLAPNANRRDVTQYCGGCAYRSTVKTGEATAIIDYDLDSAVITSITGYDHYNGFATVDPFQSPLGAQRYRKNDSSESFGQELRIASADKSSSLQWLLGGYYYWNRIEQTIRLRNGVSIDEYGIAAFGTTRVYGLPGDAATLPASATSELFAAFGNASYALTDQLTIKAGARYSSEKKHAISEGTQFALDPRNQGTSLVQFVAAAAFDLEKRFEHLTGDVALQYQIDPDVMVYGTFSTAYKSGGFNVGISTTAANAPYDAEKVKNFEVGFKGLFFDRRLRMNLAAFYTIINDYQAASFEGFRYGVGNADATTRGIELDALARLGGGLSIDANLAYVDAYYRNFVGGPCFPGNTDTTPTGCDLSGKMLPYSSKFRGSVGLSYESENGLYGRVDQFFTSKYNGNTNLDPRSVQKAYGLTNARIGWQMRNLDFALYVTNIFDKVYMQFDAAAPITLGPGLQSFLLGHRQVGATARINF